MNESIKYDSRELSDVIQILFEISCYEIYRFYLDEMQINLTNQIVKMQGTKDRCLQEIYRNIFGYDKNAKSVNQALDPQNFLNLFNEDKFVRFFNKTYIL